MAYIKLLFILLWLYICCFFGLLLVVLRFRNTNNNSLLLAMFSFGARLISRVDVEVVGRENLPKDKPVIYVGNHQSGFDMITFGAIGLPNIIAIGKKELLYIPVFGLLLWATGNILIDRKKQRKSLHQLDEATQRIQQYQNSILIFPEGTRNKESDELLTFKKGAFLIAIRAGVDVVPIICSSIHSFVSSEKMILKKGRATISILPAISTDEHDESNVKELAEKVRSVMQKELDIDSK